MGLTMIFLMESDMNIDLKVSTFKSILVPGPVGLSMIVLDKEFVSR